MTGNDFINFIRENDLDYKEVSLAAIWQTFLFIQSYNESGATFKQVAIDFGFSEEFIDAVIGYAKEQNWEFSFGRNSRKIEFEE